MFEFDEVFDVGIDVFIGEDGTLWVENGEEFYDEDGNCIPVVVEVELEDWDEDEEEDEDWDEEEDEDWEWEYLD